MSDSHSWEVTAAIGVALLVACYIGDRIDRHLMRNRCWFCGSRLGQPHFKGCRTERLP